jgi:hypothetical protein
MRIARPILAILTSTLLAVPSFAAASPHDHHDHEAPCHPTEAEKRETAEFARATKAAAERFEDPSNALNDHYEPWVDSWKPIYHFVNYEHYYDWKVLDPERPEAYVYAHTLTGTKLIGVMYSMEDPDRPEPAFGGCITQWHRHPQCMSPIGYSHIWEEDWGSCPPGWTEDPEGSELMLHVWTVPMKDGPYAMDPDPEWYCWPKPTPC